jgi:hypothetical protein
MRSPRLKNVFAVGVLLAFQTSLVALPILPGNEHPHDKPGDVTWHHTGSPGGPINDPDTHLHQHWDDLALNVNHGDGSYFANGAWDNNGTTTTYHDATLGDAAFGHGFIANRVLYWFDPAFAPPDNSFIDRVNETFAEWDSLVSAAFQAANRTDRVLGMNFAVVGGATAPAETHVEVEFKSLGTGTTGSFSPSTHILAFNTVDFTWYTGTAAPGAGQRDFITTARHEIGHVIGLDHTFEGPKTVGHSIMGSGAAANGVRVAIDAGSIQGALALYTQTVPEPYTILITVVPLIVFAHRKRVRKK